MPTPNDKNVDWKETLDKDFELVIKEMDQFYLFLDTFFKNNNAAMGSDFKNEFELNNKNMAGVVSKFKSFKGQIRENELKDAEKVALHLYLQSFAKFLKDPTKANTTQLNTDLEKLLAFTNGTIMEKVFAGIALTVTGALMLGIPGGAISLIVLSFIAGIGTQMVGLASLAVLATIAIVAFYLTIAAIAGFANSIDNLGKLTTSKFSDANEPVVTLANERLLRDDQPRDIAKKSQYYNFFQHTKEEQFFNNTSNENKVALAKPIYKSV